MEISGIYQQSVYSLKQAIGMATLRKSMNQDAAAVSALLNDMQSVNAGIMEHSVTPHKGGNVDIKI